MILSLYPAASFCSSPKFSKFPLPSSSSSSCFRVVCHGGSHAPYATSELKLALHDALDSTGIDTTYARCGSYYIANTKVSVLHEL
ncbi:hypothetical protein Pint_05254 [Pistacia integerrima]|uniref:Uncharacterized protein n=1 Tax=Pistacia integerrima TaxID=434235 RepID=A0ACC0Z6U3_9ROSI|nr:hypothetical protein Pint_05254 [Pistacia integerrima]